MHSHIPKSNEKYWAPKLRKNTERDSEKEERLKNQGWKILWFWEHELKNTDCVADKIIKALQHSE